MMPNPRFQKIKAIRQDWLRTIGLYVYRETREGQVSVAQDMAYSVIAEGEMPSCPTISLGITEAQGLMDELWLCGLRPTEGVGSAGSLAATERHLEDMRALVGLSHRIAMPGGKK